MPHGTSPARSSSLQSLSASALTRFVRSCFTESLCDVDFTQAMTAVQYLAALEERRKREFCAALRRLNIDESTLEQQKHSIRQTSPTMANWIGSMEDRARKAEALYTQVYIGLRRWALINEMRLLPFDRRNCIAMLDQLYPAEYAKLPTPQLTSLILNAQRDAFLKYIEAVGKHGRSVLKNLENQSKRPGDANGWPVVHDILERYLKQSNRVVDACSPIKGPEVFERCTRIAPEDTTTTPRLTSRSSRPTLQTSHTSPAVQSRRPSTSQGTSPTSPSQGPAKLRKEPSESHMAAAAATHEPPRQLKKSRSTLNRLAQEFRRFKSKSADARNDGALRSHSAMEHRAGAHQRSQSSAGSGSRSASVTRSPAAAVATAAAAAGTSSSSSGCGSGAKHAPSPSFDRSNSLSSSTAATMVGSPMMGGSSVTIDDAYRERLIQEAKRNKAHRRDTTAKRQHSPTHFKMEEERRYRAPRASPFSERTGAAHQPAELDADVAAAADPYFFITDAATRSTPARSNTAPALGLLRAGDLKIAELAA